MSDTPRTDAAAFKAFAPPQRTPVEAVSAAFARQLERELALEHEQWRMTAERLESVERELAQAKEARKAQSRTFEEVLAAALATKAAGEALAEIVKSMVESEDFEGFSQVDAEDSLAQWEALKTL